MHIKLVVHVLGLLLIFLSTVMLLPIPFSLYYGDGVHIYFIISALITFLVGFTAFKLTRLDRDVHAREGFAIVTLGWISFALFGCLPFILSGYIPSLTSGEVLPNGLEAWVSSFSR
jgi:trk system potassium uptake protein TrkH